MFPRETAPTGRDGPRIRVRVVFHGDGAGTPEDGAPATPRRAWRCSGNRANWGSREHGRRLHSYRFVAVLPAHSPLLSRSRTGRTVSWACTGKTTLVPREGTPREHGQVKGKRPYRTWRRTNPLLGRIPADYAKSSLGGNPEIDARWCRNSPRTASREPDQPVAADSGSWRSRVRGVDWSVA